MKYMFLEFKFIKPDMNKILLSCAAFLLFGTMICLKGGVFHSSSLTESIKFLFGSVNLSSVNWMYWLLFCFGYVVLLQLIWKKREKNVEHNVLILLQDTSLYCINRLAIGLFFYISLCFVCVFHCYRFLYYFFRYAVSYTSFASFNVRLHRYQFLLARCFVDVSQVLYHKSFCQCVYSLFVFCRCKDTSPFYAFILWYD